MSKSQNIATKREHGDRTRERRQRRARERHYVRLYVLGSRDWDAYTEPRHLTRTSTPREV